MILIIASAKATSSCGLGIVYWTTCSHSKASRTFTETINICHFNNVLALIVQLHEKI